jgi:hypothetical protein
MARIDSIAKRKARFRWWLAAPVASCCAALLAVSPAWGGVGLGATPTYPSSLQVGQTNIAASLQIKNTSTSPENAGQLTVTSIKHTPSCGEATTPCPAGQQDTGVFLVKGPAVGAIGTACAGKSFTIGSPDATTGEVEFSPVGGSVILQPPGTAGDACTINFLVDFLKLPTKDASPSPGIQTAQLARASGTVGTVGGSGTGASLVTGSAQTRHTPAPALSPAVLGIVAVLLGAFGVARLRRRPAAQPVRRVC